MRLADQTVKDTHGREWERPPRQCLADLTRSLRHHLTCQATMGLEWLPWHPPPSIKELPETLEQIRADLGECRRCRLYASRSNIVFGEGNASARVVLVGEAPGYEEDRQGRPFVGAAGRLLDRIIAAMGWRRDEVYICNVLKCRPPGNRDPWPDEIENCAPFLRRQLRAVGPRAVMALGSFAARFLVSSQEPISKLRGCTHELEGIPLVCSYHPAYLLRNPSQKRQFWEDARLLLHLIRRRAREAR